MTSETRRTLKAFLEQVVRQQSNAGSDFVANGLPRAFSRESVWITLNDAEATALRERVHPTVGAWDGAGARVRRPGRHRGQVVDG